mgnify:CR=1 FL=1
MSRELAQSHFENRYLRWALREVDRELQANFASLCSFRYGLALRYLQFLAEIPENERRGAALALVKWRLYRQRRSAGSLEAWQELEDQVSGVADSYSRAIVRVSNQEWERRELRLSKPHLFRYPRKLLKESIKQRMTARFGMPAQDEQPSSWRYETQFGKVLLVTTLDVGSRTQDLTYRHEVFVSPNDSLKGSVSLLSWLGISGQTEWSLIKTDEIEMVSESVEQLCSRFHDALPSLIADLPI